MSGWRRGLALLLLLIAGCSAAGRSTEQLPTAVPTLVAARSDAAYTLDAAASTAQNFLESWRLGDFESMFSLLSFASREATPIEIFRALYQDAYTEMTLQSLNFRPNTLIREQERVAIFNYDVTFNTNILGEFRDTERNLRLIVDEQTDDWRIAWTPEDILSGMEGGARLRLERIIPSRANIYARDGQILADQNGRVVTINVIKQDIPLPETCLITLSEATGDPIDELRAILDASGADWLTAIGSIRPQTYLAWQTQLEQDCNARFSEQPTRRYVDGSLAPHILGHVGFPDEDEVASIETAGFQADSILGRSGIEASWDETLRGRPGGRLVIVSPGGQRLRIVAESPSQPSQSVWLTLDPGLQQFAYDTIANAYRQAAGGWGSTSKGAAAVVLDANNGEILAMVSYPTYDGNIFAPFPPFDEQVTQRALETLQNDRRIPQLNRAALGHYPLGSVMKTVSALAVVSSNVYEINERYNCAGVWNRDIPRFDWRPGGHGVLNLSQALVQSCNSYFYEVGYQLDQIDSFILPNMARHLGLGEVTGLGDVAEASGTIPDPDWVSENIGLEWTFSDSVNTAVGQGYVEVTPLQIARLFAAFGNGGQLVRPRLVQQVGILGEEPSFVAEAEAQDLNLNPELIETLQNALCSVTTHPSGTATHIFRNSDLLTNGICGKTGTAQATGDGVLPHAWFAAFAPRENPEIAIAVIVENAGDGSAVAAPIVREIAEYYFAR